MLHEGFYKTAKSDFRVARIMYSLKEYPSSIYYMQQGVEKLSKAFGLFVKILKPKDIKDISHNTKKIFSNHIEYYHKEFIGMANLRLIYPDLLSYNLGEYEINLTNCLENWLQDSKSVYQLNPIDFNTISDEDLDYILDQINSIETELFFDFNELKSKFPKILESILPQIENKMKMNFNEMKGIMESEKFNSSLHFQLNNHLPYLMKIIKMYVSLFFFALITSGHNQMTRYPCLICGELPEENYNHSQVLVRRFEEILSNLEDIMKIFEEIYLLKEGFDLSN